MGEWENGSVVVWESRSNVEQAHAWNVVRLSEAPGSEVLDSLIEDLLLHVLLVGAQLSFRLFA